MTRSIAQGPPPKDFGTPTTSRTLAFYINNSKESFSAFSWASANLIQPNDQLLMIHVYSSYTKAPTGSDFLSRFDELCTRNKLRHEIIVVDGDPAYRIAEITARRRCDLCILGMKTKSALMRTVHGCLASQTASLCLCPVVIVKIPKVSSSFQPNVIQSQT
jgi:nucleotide-binding universal stress UspA family protein